MTEQENQETQEQTSTEAQPDKNSEKKFSQAELDKIIKERLERESTKRKEAEDKIKEQAEREALAKNQEWEKLAKKREDELAEALQKIKAHELNELRSKAAAKYQLPLEIAERLRGETLEELEKDAESLKALIPDAKQQGKLNATNPGSGGKQVGETIEQKRKRLLG